MEETGEGKTAQKLNRGPPSITAMVGDAISLGEDNGDGLQEVGSKEENNGERRGMKLQGRCSQYYLGRAETATEPGYQRYGIRDGLDGCGTSTQTSKSKRVSLKKL